MNRASRYACGGRYDRYSTVPERQALRPGHKSPHSFIQRFLEQLESLPDYLGDRRISHGQMITRIADKLLHLFHGGPLTVDPRKHKVLPGASRKPSPAIKDPPTASRGQRWPRSRHGTA